MSSPFAATFMEASAWIKRVATGSAVVYIVELQIVDALTAVNDQLITQRPAHSRASSSARRALPRRARLPPALSSRLNGGGIDADPSPFSDEQGLTQQVPRHGQAIEAVHVARGIAADEMS